MRVVLFRMIFLTTWCILPLSLMGCANSQAPQTSVNISGPVAQSSSAASSPLAQTGEQPLPPGAVAPSKGKVYACALLTSDEIRSVQGEALKETKESGSVEGGISISQCFFAMPTFTNSISLSVMQKGDAAGARDPKEFWESTFHKKSEQEREKERGRKSEREREREAEKKREGNREEEEEGAPPKSINGIGDEAFWTGSRVGGALYVLKGNSYIRISVGGAGDEQAKINKSTTLARLALKRF